MRPMPELEVVMVPTEELVEYRNNAKLHPSWQIDQIAASIEEFGFNSPVLAWHNDEGEPEIVAGHGRLMAARKLDLEKLPVVFLDHMTEEQRRAYILVDNQLTMNSGFDFDILNEELSEITGIDMEQFDFEIRDEDIESVDEGQVEGLAPEERGVGGARDQREYRANAEIEEDDVPDSAPTVCRRGQIWRLGGHRLMCGDATSRDDMERLMDGKEADICFSEPPFIIKAEFSELRGSYGGDYGEKLKNASEIISPFCGGVLLLNTGTVEFAAQVISSFADEIVLDPFGGTGTTMIAAEQVGLVCYMMESDPACCDIAIERWKNLTGGQPELEEDPQNA